MWMFVIVVFYSVVLFLMIWSIYSLYCMCYSHNINVEGLLFSCPWVCWRWWLEPLFFGLPAAPGAGLELLLLLLFLHSTKFQIYNRDPFSNVKVFQRWNHISGYAPTFPLGFRNLRENPHRLRGLELKKSNNKTKHAWIRSLRMMNLDRLFSKHICFGTLMLKQTQSNAEFRVEVASELCIR